MARKAGHSTRLPQQGSMAVFHFQSAKNRFKTDIMFFTQTRKWIASFHSVKPKAARLDESRGAPIVRLTIHTRYRLTLIHAGCLHRIFIYR
jgi:hypothetical protein